jgi:nitrite reductase (NADH) small subunit
MTALASTWTRVGRVEDIPLLEGRSTSVDGRRIAVFRLLGGFAAIDAHCPHAAGPLHDGIVADSCVTCPLHGRRFDLVTGAALNGPETVAVHEVAERDGEIWVRLA